jgi:CRP-like cAMP-binding protein
LQSDIAAFIGNQRETVARGMMRLKREGIINYSRSKITVLNLLVLESLAATGSWKSNND